MDERALADELDRRIRMLSEPTTESVRRVRREFSKDLRTESGEYAVALAWALADRQRWVAFELIYHHPTALTCLSVEDVEGLAGRLDSWVSVDTFGCCVSGPAWRRGVIPDEVIHRWAGSEDRWWRRAALVSTVPLNLRSRGGTGDAERTLDICARLVSDRDDMVVKALSWALRQLVIWDPDAVRSFIRSNQEVLAARVVRETGHKLDTGYKNPPRTSRAR
ncbi:DNA alkylation repair protein [Streptomyces bathyalis]|uniref:DNA alkylation repair protein n=1 Tax=Streptomyces bathyalis TaxID=2710756 RepID=A0A7T1WSQ6_9ACTN|nr:DNA alkylation repair protein [Streptomyces bathyalis]QPP07392.1 DNA alkylation repair protein [Streptomyces bathyalis]